MRYPAERTTDCWGRRARRIAPGCACDEAAVPVAVPEALGEVGAVSALLDR